MEVTETKSEGLRREYAFAVSAADIRAKTTEKLETVRADFQMKGFRKGKAPLPLLKKMFGKSILGEVVRESVDGAVRQHLSDSGHRPAAQPDVKMPDEEFDEDRNLTFEVSYDCLPEVPEVDLSAIALERKTVEVDDRTLNEALERLAAESPDYVRRGKGAKAETRDRVVLDFSGTVDGKAFEGGTAEDYPLVLGSNSFLPGFEDRLVGVKAGESRDVDVVFPENYGAAGLAGKKAVFACRVKEVLRPKPAAVDDALAERRGAADLDELKTRMKTQIGAEFAEASRSLLKRRLLDALDGMMSFELPAGLVEVETAQIARQLRDEETPGETPGGEGADPGGVEPTAEHEKIARRRVRLGLFLAEIGRREGVEVTEREMGEEIVRQSRAYPGRERAFFEFVKQNRQAMENVRAPLFEDKVVDLILEKAAVRDVTVTAEALRDETEALDAEET